ncbi:tyrosine-protein kinase RYK-like isoform X2 [Centruroides sculpturatus]|uniref:tyrosine-protein kinase RYK-like isoform X2 n=1 Tax=Centruroides sculpturatus TaxID=218467 RepID=UPI000C6DF297|nr:tyrosine-protein kinase RYK-like isoform X2 [Centruroides sculpturatus]
MFHLKVILLELSLFLINLKSSEGNLNLFVTRKEVKDLLGLNAELSYVREGKVNDYALGFVVLIPDHISELHFTWQRLSPIPMPYSVGIMVSDNQALGTPQLNISHRGLVPMQEEVFQVVLPCTGKFNAEVDVKIYINITMPNNNITSLILRRKKICLKDGNHNGTLLMATDAIATTSPFFIGVGCASAVMIIITILAIASCLRAHKTRRDAVNFGRSSPVLSTQCQTFLRVDTPNNISNTGSYTSFRRLSPVSVGILSQSNDLKTTELSEQLTELSIERKNIILQDKITEGTFGQIYHGTLIEDEAETKNKKNIFIKTVSDQASPVQISLLLKEGTMFYGMNHINILSVVAVCLDDVQHPLIVYPFVDQGNFKKFLQKCKSSSEGHCHTLLTQDLVDIAIQIVQGMIYLHKRKLIHTDLATRNCVIDTWLKVKITDNALSRDLFPNDYHCLGDNENRPVKWLAPESLLHKEFSPSSDVWAFGVTLWELMTLGQQPYIEVDPFEMGVYLRDNYRLSQPINCPDELFTVMACCWASSPDERPTFSQLLRCLKEFHATLVQYI